MLAGSLFRIAGGYVYDPRHGIDGQVQDVWIQDGRIVPPPSTPAVRPDRVLNAAGLVVMPGGIDMHCHIAGPKVNSGRKLRPEEKRGTQPVLRGPITRSGTWGSVPSTFATAYKYAGLGYTTAFDAAVPPLAARHAHEEFHDTPCLDKGFYVLMGNNHYVLRALHDRDPDRLRHFVAWLLAAAKGYAVKLVNPGGVEVWKQRAAGNVRSLDDRVEPFGVTPREIVAGLARAADELALPHAVHIHANQLGLPGNWRTTLATMEALEGHRGHLTHIQFHSYGGGDEDEQTFCSRVAPLADYVNRHPQITVDVGQVLFGETTSMTGDGPLGYYLQQVYGSKWFSADVEMEAGCGIAPIVYRNRSLVHAWQWAVGLEWYLLVEDPWQVAMSTDHPNGASFLAYPQIIRLLMDRAYRQEMLSQVHPQVREQSLLKDLQREYTLREIAIITRAGPARMLGLHQKGHLGVGADADVTIYTPHEDKQRMFELPRYVIKGGRLLVENGEIRAVENGKTWYVAPEYDTERQSDIARWFGDCYSVRFRNYPVADEEVPGAEQVACRRA
ncbi:MAG: formylmethanofuran dehydrogenase subunit A [Pirellulaceae bacterium]